MLYTLSAADTMSHPLAMLAYAIDADSAPPYAVDDADAARCCYHNSCR